jgi:DNA-binding HxlR family transcriptional regulator
MTTTTTATTTATTIATRAGRGRGAAREAVARGPVRGAARGPAAAGISVPGLTPAAHGVCEHVLVDCRLRAATELFAHTWDPLVVAALSNGPLRRRALLASTGGMSDKVLTETLRRLLANGLVERRSYPAAPPRVEYGLTPLGASLAAGPLRAMADWTTAHGEELLEAQERATRG